MAASDIDEIVGVVLHIILNIIKVMCKWIRGDVFCLRHVIV